MQSSKKTIRFTVTLLSVVFLWTAAVQAETVTYDGLIKPYEIVDIGAPAEGIVARVAVDRSSAVAQGQLLVELESSVQRAAYEKARSMAAFDDEIGLQQARLAFARRVFHRVDRLATAVSAHDKDQAATEIVLTEYLLGKARENRTMARLEVKRARALLDRCTIKSPIAGLVVDRYVSPGEYVNNQPLLRIARVDPLRVEVIVPARMFGRVGPGMTATVVPELTAYGERTATVRIVDGIVDSASNTFGVLLDLPNTRQPLPAGLKCQVRFEIEVAIEPVGPPESRSGITLGQKQD